MKITKHALLVGLCLIVGQTGHAGFFPTIGTAMPSCVEDDQDFIREQIEHLRNLLQVNKETLETAIRNAKSLAILIEYKNQELDRLRTDLATLEALLRTSDPKSDYYRFLQSQIEDRTKRTNELQAALAADRKNLEEIETVIADVQHDIASEEAELQELLDKLKAPC